MDLVRLPAAGAAGLKNLLTGFADVFAGANFELTPLLRAMWTHDEFYSDAGQEPDGEEPGGLRRAGDARLRRERHGEDVRHRRPRSSASSSR